MSRHGDHHKSARLAGLQRLATTLRREELGSAREETDRCAEAEQRAVERNRQAEATLDEVVGEARLCLDSLFFAGLGLEVSATQLKASQAALEHARDEERTALASYGEAEQRLKWISNHARDLRRRHLAKREENAMSEAALLRGAARSAQ